MIWLLLAACYSGGFDLNQGWPRPETWPLTDDNYDEHFPVDTADTGYDPEQELFFDTGEIGPGDIGAAG